MNAIPSQPTTFANGFVNNYITTNQLNILGYDENKPWGGYYIFEQGDNFDRKILWIKAKELLSLQFHGTAAHPGHSELFEALTDMRVIMSTATAINTTPGQYEELLKNLLVIDVKADEKVEIGSGFLHAYANPFDHDIYLLETRTSPVDESSQAREENITRVYDQTQRYGTPVYPAELLARVYDIARI